MKIKYYSDIIIDIVAVIIMLGIVIWVILSMWNKPYTNSDLEMRWCLQRYYSYDYCKESMGNNNNEH